MSKKATMSDEEFKKAQMDIQRQYQGLDMQYKSQVKNTMDKVLAEVSTTHIALFTINAMQ